MENERELRKIEAKVKTKEIEARMTYDLGQVESQERVNTRERET